MSRVVVIGAGVGGLTTAAGLARAGLEVTVLEATNLRQPSPWVEYGLPTAYWQK